MTASHILGSVALSIVAGVGIGVVGDYVVVARTDGATLPESTGGAGAHHVSGEDSRGLWSIDLAVSRSGTNVAPWTVTHSGSAGTYSMR